MNRPPSPQKYNAIATRASGRTRVLANEASVNASILEREWGAD